MQLGVPFFFAIATILRLCRVSPCHCFGLPSRLQPLYQHDQSHAGHSIPPLPLLLLCWGQCSAASNCYGPWAYVSPGPIQSSKSLWLLQELLRQCSSCAMLATVWQIPQMCIRHTYTITRLGYDQPCDTIILMDLSKCKHACVHICLPASAHRCTPHGWYVHRPA